MKDIDNQIIESLKKNARTPFLQIAKQLDVSEGTIRNRVGRLLKKGIIKKFTIEAASEASAVIEVKTQPEIATGQIVNEIKKLGIEKIMEVAGRFDILCFARTKNLEETNTLVEKIRAIKGVANTETFPVLREG